MPFKLAVYCPQWAQVHTTELQRAGLWPCVLLPALILLKNTAPEDPRHVEAEPSSLKRGGGGWLRDVAKGYMMTRTGHGKMCVRVSKYGENAAGPCISSSPLRDEKTRSDN